MSSDFSQLPANCSSDLQQFCLEKSEDEMLSSLEDNPQKLLDFFEVACADLQWQQNNNDLFQRVAEKITSAEELHQYNSEQINTISGICEGILTSPEQNPIREPMVDVYRHSLNLEHALSMVTKEGLDPSSVIVRECLAFLEKDTGQKISRSDDAKIEIIIHKDNPRTDQLLDLISDCDAVIRDKIDIHICPEEGISKESLDALAEKYGQHANSLTLVKNILDNEHLADLCKNFTQIHRLTVKGNQITALPQLPHPDKLTVLNCSYTKIEELPPEYTQLTRLECSFCKTLSRLPPEYTQLTSLDCSGCSFKELPPQYSQLTSLECSFCKTLSGLPPQYSQLTSLDCRLCSIEKLPPEYTQLTSLDCSGCSFKELPPQYSQLTSLDCSGCSFKELPPQYSQLTSLDCSNCPIEELPPEYIKLTSLDCSNCPIEKLPPEYIKLTRLNCSECTIEELPPEYTQLIALNCYLCENLTQLPPEYTQLTSLKCSECTIEKLPPQYSQLTSLECSFCPLKELPPEYINLTYLNCSECTIEVLPAQYTQLTRLECRDCEQLTELSKYKLVSNIHQLNPENAGKFAVSMNLSLDRLRVFSHFMQMNHDLSEDFLEVLENFDAKAISRELENKNLLEIIGEIVPDDPIQQLYIYQLCAKIDDVEKLESFLKLVVKSPMDNELKTFYQNLMQNEPLSLPDSIFIPDEWSHSERLQALNYLLLIEGRWESVTENISHLQKSGLWEEFQQDFPPNRFFAEILQSQDLFKGNREEDSQTIARFNPFSIIIKEGTSKLLEKNDAEIKALLGTPPGKKLAREMAKDFLAERRLQTLIKEIYPPDDPENVSLYPIQAKMTGQQLDLTIIPEMPLLHPDTIFTTLSRYEQAQDFYIIHYAGQGIDQGGLSSQFIAQTLQGIRNKSEKFNFEKLKSKDTGITSMIPVPAFNPSFTMTEEQVQVGRAQEKENYHLLGKFLGLALRNNNPIGRVFHPKFFDTIYLFNDADLDQSDFSARNYLDGKKPQEMFDFIKEYLTEAEEIPSIKGLFADVQAVLKAEDLEELKGRAEELNNIWSEESLEDALESKDKEKIKACVVGILADTYYGRLEVMHAMAKGMREALPFQVGNTNLSKWDEVKFVTTEQFSDALQGKLTVDWIKQNLSFHPKGSDEAKKLEGWIHSWLDDNKDNPEALSNVIVTFTGSTALATPIVFHFDAVVKDISPHTCSNAVDVPMDIDEEGLRVRLDSWGKEPEIEMTRA